MMKPAPTPRATAGQGDVDKADIEKVSPESAARKTRSIAPTLVAVVPLAISQHTSVALGFKTPRAFLEWVIETNVPHTKRGQDVLVEAATALRALGFGEALAPKKTSAPHDEDDGVDRVLRAIGRRRS